VRGRSFDRHGVERATEGGHSERLGCIDASGAHEIDAARLWERVEADLGRDWDGRGLSQVAALSEEHLRRLCHRHDQRSPMAYLAQLRLHRAATLLR